ncbi:MAG: hypothetical protein J1G06_05625 [Oscillospiraceae bacterium]|nr:hypothetical protein [Oscillospiraceae bacterium]
MSFFVYMYVILVILFGLIGLIRAAYASIKLRKEPKDTILSANTADMQKYKSD